MTDRISGRLLPLHLISYLISLMDRSNISYASVQMNADLQFSAAVYGLGAGFEDTACASSVQLSDLTLEEMEAAWTRAKQQE